MDHSQRLALPFLAPGQSQKELFHNEALQMLDIVVAAAVEEGPRNDPPEAPGAGSAYIVGGLPTAAWTGHAHSLAQFTAAGWRFIAPVEGLQAWVKTSGCWAVFVDGAWEVGVLRGDRLLVGGVQVVGARSGAIPDAAGGTTVDAQARSAIAAILASMRGHGLIAAA